LKDMSKFRRYFFCNLLTVFAGLAFINMSFVLAEFAALGLTRENSSLVRNLANSGFEEEKETESGEDSAAKELDLSFQEHLKHQAIIEFSIKHHAQNVSNNTIDPGHKRTFSPPPELV
jgi:Na+-transporting methylmalonyl-CoA/oxaloacetate decarboxylase gamma subunit